jgi:hypothetical protein
LLTPSFFSRNCSRCATAFFITSADCSTNGKISSPAPNLSPTSFIAGKSTLLSTSTGSRRVEHLVDLRLDAVLAAAQDRVVDARLDRRVGVVVAARRRGRGGPSSVLQCSITRCNASGRRSSTRSSHSSRSSRRAPRTA